MMNFTENWCGDNIDGYNDVSARYLITCDGEILTYLITCDGEILTYLITCDGEILTSSVELRDTSLVFDWHHQAALLIWPAKL